MDVSQLSSSSTPVLLGPSLPNGKTLVLFARPFQGGGGVDDRVALRKGREGAPPLLSDSEFEALLIAPSPLVVFKLPRSYSYSTPGLQ